MAINPHTLKTAATSFADSGGFGSTGDVVSAAIDTFDSRTDGTKSAAGSAVSGALQGAQMGAAGGPLGMAIGAGVMGTISAVKQVKENKAIKEENERRQAEERTMRVIQKYAPVDNAQQMFAKGAAKIAQTKFAELEKDELILRKNSKGGYDIVADFSGGKTHEQGGEGYVVTPGDIIIPADKRDKVTAALDKGYIGTVNSVVRSLPADNTAMTREEYDKAYFVKGLDMPNNTPTKRAKYPPAILPSPPSKPSNEDIYEEVKRGMISDSNSREKVWEANQKAKELFQDKEAALVKKSKDNKWDEDKYSKEYDKLVKSHDRHRMKLVANAVPGLREIYDHLLDPNEVTLPDFNPGEWYRETLGKDPMADYLGIDRNKIPKLHDSAEDVVANLFDENPVSTMVKNAVRGGKDPVAEVQSDAQKAADAAVAKTKAAKAKLSKEKAADAEFAKGVASRMEMLLPSSEGRLPSKDNPVELKESSSPFKAEKDAATADTMAKINDILAYAPAAANIIRGMQTPEKVDRSYMTPETVQYKDQSAAARQDVEDQNILEQTIAARYSGGSAQSALAGRVGAGSRRFRRLNQINQGEQQRADAIEAGNVGIRNQAQQTNINLKNQYDTMDAQNKAAVDAYMSRGIADVGRIHTQQVKDSNAQEVNDKMLDLAQTSNYSYDKDTNTIQLK